MTAGNKKGQKCGFVHKSGGKPLERIAKSKKEGGKDGLFDAHTLR